MPKRFFSNRYRTRLRGEQLERRQMLAADPVASLSTDPATTSSDDALPVAADSSSTNSDVPRNKNKGRVSGYVYLDNDQDGARDTGETGLAGWTVYVDENRNGTRDKRESSTQTDANGRYEFDLRRLKPTGYGHYITVASMSGYQHTSKMRHSVLVVAGVHKANKNFGMTSEQGGDGSTIDTSRPIDPAHGRVSGRLFLDADQDGKRDTREDGLADWIVYVDANRNGRRDASEVQIQTDATGRYEIDTTPRGSGHGLRINVELKPHFENTTTLSRSVLVQAGIHKTGKDFGVIRTNGVTGFVFRDTDQDRKRDAGEASMANWSLFVDENGNGRHDIAERKTTTNRNGRYSFQSFDPGSHSIVVIAKDGFEFTTTSTRNVSVTTNGVVSGRNFGVVRTQSSKPLPPQIAVQKKVQISGRVFEDANGDGVRTNNETTLANWRIFVDANRNGHRDADEMSMLTDSSGRYEFTVVAGTYHIGVESRSGFDFTTNQIRSVNVIDGTDKRRRDFGVVRESSAPLPSAADAARSDAVWAGVARLSRGTGRSNDAIFS